MVSGLLGLLIFIGDIYAIIAILKSGIDTGAKALWCLLVLILPVLGFIIWYFAGPRMR